jgi:hypothetical protein
MLANRQAVFRFGARNSTGFRWGLSFFLGDTSLKDSPLSGLDPNAKRAEFDRAAM